jgi:hypothetical protein
MKMKTEFENKNTFYVEQNTFLLCGEKRKMTPGLAKNKV